MVLRGEERRNKDEVEVQELLPSSQVVITFAGQLAPANRNAALQPETDFCINLMQLIAHVSQRFRTFHFNLQTLKAPQDGT